MTRAPTTSPAGAPARRPRGEPRPFDFRHPSTLSREHVRTMQIVQEALARGFTTTFASSLRAVTRVAIRDVVQCPYDEFVGRLPDPTLLIELGLPPLPGSSLLHIELPVAFAATELLLGGRGGPDQPARAMTELECGLMRNIVELALPAIGSAFEPVVAVTPTYAGQESKPQFAQLTSPTDMVLVVSFDVKIEDAAGSMDLCMPYGSLLPHLEALSEQARAGALSADKLAEERARLHVHLAGAPVEAAVTFRPLVAPSDEVVALARGDVLLLNHPLEMPLTMSVDGIPVHDVHVGRVNRHYAVRVDDATDPGRHRRPSRLLVTPRKETP